MRRLCDRMLEHEEFTHQLREALGHLYDPTYRAPELLARVLAASAPSGAGAAPVGSPQTVLTAALTSTIRALEPAADVPPTARSRRVYELLFARYILNQTQDDVAAHLGITTRHLRREQQEAVDILARRLWEATGGSGASPGGPAAPPASPQPAVTPAHRPATGTGSPATPTWRSQVRQELAALQQTLPCAIADVGQAIRRVIELESSVASLHGVALLAGTLPEGLTVAMHASALRQILVASLGQLVQSVPDGRVTISAEPAVRPASGGPAPRIKISLQGCPQGPDPAPGGPPDHGFADEILAVVGGGLAIGSGQGCLTFALDLPAAEMVKVLVVDDNLDLVHFYQRFTEGTRYQVVHQPSASGLCEVVEAVRPSVIVLDIMLPDLDGWDLLVELRKHPATAAIPIIVCSVMREEELALSLGARLYLPKPVGRREFIQALTQAINLA